MSISAYVDRSGGAQSFDVALPDHCPICHKGIEAIAGPHQAANFCDGEFTPPNTVVPSKLQVVLRCPREECRRLFVAMYSRIPGVTNASQRNYWKFDRCTPIESSPRAFESPIPETSPSFVKIYNQAAQAESLGLDEICGPGYRKALEFLIKDYAKKTHSGQDETIERMFLGKCISEYIEGTKIKECASRAAWLGNDETHYSRRWTGEDIASLKTLIELTVHWISSEVLTQEFLQRMPAKEGT
jgi:hypothetical protein